MTSNNINNYYMYNFIVRLIIIINYRFCYLTSKKSIIYRLFYNSFLFYYQTYNQL